MKRIFFALLGAVAAIWLYRRGVFHGFSMTTVVFAGVALTIVGGMFGGLIGAGHTRERRAWSDYQTVRAAVPMARRAWFTALAESLRRMALPAVVAAATLALLIWKGRSR
jgi:hypothetical protein